MTEEKCETCGSLTFQFSDKERDGIGVIKGPNGQDVIDAWSWWWPAMKTTRADQQPAPQQASPAEQMMQRPVNQPGGLGATPVQQSGGGDIMLCPNGGGAHQFKQGISQKSGKPWKAWECGDRRCNMDGNGGNRQWIR